MGNTVSYIIPNDFHEVNNPEARKKYLNRTMQLVRDYFCADWAAFQNENDVDVDTWDHFLIRPLPVLMELHDGFWIAQTLISYWYYFMPDKNGRVGLREDNFDFCRMFGKEDGYAFDLDVLDFIDDMGFEMWLEEEKKIKGADWRIPEYDAAFWRKEENLGWRNIKNCYHDSFVECREILQGYQQDFPGYDILSTRLWGNFIFGRKDGMLYLLDTKTCKTFNKNRLEFVDFHHEGVEIRTDGTKFLIDYDGNPITEASHS